MHTYCVKSIACNEDEFHQIIAHKQNPNLILIQGFNNQWNEAAKRMRDLLQNDNGIGKMLGGECVCWGRQNLKMIPQLKTLQLKVCFFTL